MKTNVVMVRSLCGVAIRQDKESGFFNVNDLATAGNQAREAEGLGTKVMGTYFETDSSAELINAICVEEHLELHQVKQSRRGRLGGTWVHPILFVDMAMWYSPALKVKVLRWVMDGLLTARDNSGDSFKAMNIKLTDRFPAEFDRPLAYVVVANRIADACGVSAGAGRWESATEAQLQTRTEIQKAVCTLATYSPNVGTTLVRAIKEVKQGANL